MRPLIFLIALAATAAPPVILRLPATPDQFPPTGYNATWRTIHATLPDVILTETPMPNLAKALEGQIPVVTKLPNKITPNPERLKRLNRTPRQLANELSKIYGHQLTEVVYIQAFAVIARHRLGQNVDDLVAPYLNGQKDSLAKPTASHFSGHLLFAELNQPERVKAAADLALKTRAMNNEMSDAVFMGCPLLAKAGYADAALEHLKFMQNLCLRKDGLYRHSPLNEAAWGRGNAFPALGMALMLEALPKEKRPVKDFQNLIDALLKYQTKNGMWRQVIDHPTAYEEFSATAMIAAAIHQGLREHWLKGKQYQRAVDQAWQAIKLRTSSDGKLLDVCESTGKQKTLEDYLNRTAIWDRDPRGGAMALLLATELMK